MVAVVYTIVFFVMVFGPPTAQYRRDELRRKGKLKDPVMNEYWRPRIEAYKEEQKAHREAYLQAVRDHQEMQKRRRNTNRDETI